MELETYTHSEHCHNCGEFNIVKIQKGTSIANALRYKKCRNCGVTLRQSDEDRITM